MAAKAASSCSSADDEFDDDGFDGDAAAVETLVRDVESEASGEALDTAKLRGDWRLCYQYNARAAPGGLHVTVYNERVVWHTRPCNARRTTRALPSAPQPPGPLGPRAALGAGGYRSRVLACEV